MPKERVVRLADGGRVLRLRQGHPHGVLFGFPPPVYRSGVTPCYHTGDVMPLLPALAVGAFVWAARKGQFDDLTTPAMRVLHDDEKREKKNRDD